MKRSFFLLTLTFYPFQIAHAHRTLAVRQVGLNTDTVPALTLMDDPNQMPERLNDSTIQFNVPPTGKECLFIVIDAGTRWFTRVWIDSTILHKELIINYSKGTATVKDGNETDKVLEKLLLVNGEEDGTESDSVSTTDIARHPDSFFSL